MGSTIAAAPARAPGRRWLFGALVTLFWLSLLAPPDHALGVTLDQSWEQGLGVLLSRGAQAGTDYVFTYGPLGYFLTTVYEPGLYWPKLAWEAALKLAMAWTFAAVLVRIRGAAARLAFAATIVIFLGPDDRSARDATFVTFLLCLTLLSFDRPAWSLRGCAWVLGLAVLAHVKPTIFMLAVFYLAVRAAAFAWSRRWREAVASPALFAVAWLALWVALGQSPANLAAYARGSWQLISGYADAMAMDAPDRLREVWLALAAAAALAAGWWSVPKRRRRRPRALAVATIVSGTVFLQWKEGFVRHDGLHARVFFVSALAAAFAARCRLWPVRGSRGAAVAGAAVVACCLLGISSSTYPPYELGRLIARGLWSPLRHAEAVLRPFRLKDELEAEPATMPADWPLPRIRAAVGDAPVDLFTNLQGYLFANRLNWRPRPVFQSYSAYTGPLRELNAAFIRSDSAPEYLLVAPTPIDRRPPAAEDGPALLAVLQRYRPLLIENGFLLLRRELSGPTPADEPGPVRLRRTVNLGETVSLAGVPDAYQTLSIDVRPSLAGRLWSLAYRPEPVALAVELADRRRRLYRLIPGAATDFLVNPFMEDGSNLTDLLHVYGLPGAARAVSLTVTGFDGIPFGYAPQVEVTVRAGRPPPFAPVSEADVARMLAR